MITNRLHTCMMAVLCSVGALMAQQVIVVSPRGNDRGKGTAQSPFATVERALEEARKQAGDSVEIRLREGTYPLRQTLRMEGYEHLLITAYPSEQVAVTGGVRLPLSSLKRVTDREVLDRLPEEARQKVREIDLGKEGYALTGLSPKGFGRAALPSWSELFVNGEPQRIARWPNDSTVAIGKVRCTGDIPRDKKYGIGDPVFEYEEDRPGAWKSVEDAWIAGYFAYGYADDLLPIKSVDAQQKTLTTALPTLYGFRYGSPFHRWYALNLLEELDLPGEYVIDPKRGKLYYYPQEERMDEVQVSCLGTPLFSLAGCRNVTLKGITFEYSRGMGVYIERSENTRVEQCVFRNLGYVGVCIGRGDLPGGDPTVAQHSADDAHPEGVSEVVGNLSARLYDDRLFDRQAGRNNGVVGCSFYRLGSGGVSLGGGQRASLTPAHNYVENCRIWDFNRIEKSYRPGVCIDGVGNRVSHCEIHTAPSMAILLHGNNHLVEYCDIHHVCQEVDDQGAVYYGRDPSELGNRVRYCYFHDLASKHRVSATYHDDGACGMEVTGCLYYKAGTVPVLIGGGHDNVYRNNIFVDMPVAFHIDNRMQNWSKATLDEGGLFEQRLKTVRFDQPPYSEAYPGLPSYWKRQPRVPQDNLIEGNLFYRVKQVQRGDAVWAEWNNNYVTNHNPGFKCPERPIEGFTPDAVVYQKIHGFQPIPFEEIGCKP